MEKTELLLQLKTMKKETGNNDPFIWRTWMGICKLKKTYKNGEP